MSGLKRFKIYLVNLLVILPTVFCYGQVFDITNDGKYVFADLYSSQAKEEKISALRSTSNSWYLELSNVENLKFSLDGKNAIYIQKGNLFIQSLGTLHSKAIAAADSYVLAGQHLNFIIYKQNLTEKTIIYDLKRKREFSISHLKNYFMRPNSNIFYASVNNKLDSIQGGQLLEVDMDNQTGKTIWRSEDKLFGGISFSNLGDRFGFFTRSKRGTNLWLYDIRNKTSKRIFSDSSSQLQGKFYLNPKELKFISSGDRLFFYLSKKREFPRNEYRSFIEDLNSYLDPKPNYYWRNDVKSGRGLSVTLDLISGTLAWISGENDFLIGDALFSGLSTQIGNNYALIYHFEKEAFAYNHMLIESYTANLYNFNRYVHPDVYLVNLRTGERSLVKKNVKVKSDQFPLYLLSPSGKEVLYFDTDDGHFHVFDIKQSTKLRISGTISTGFYKGDFVSKTNGIQRYYHQLVGGPGVWWMIDDLQSVIVQDKFSDLWKLSLNGGEPICLTKNFAKNKAIRFDAGLRAGDKIESSRLILKAYSKSDQLIGYYDLNITHKSELEKIMTFDGIYDYFDLKQAESASWRIWKLTAAGLPPTVYFGKTFEDRKAVLKTKAKADPVKQELLSWKDSQEKEHQGIVLFPKDFDPAKKYPMLVSYYDTNPASVLGSSKYLDHATFRGETSLGYILFVPSLEYKVGYTSASVTNIVVSGTKELMKRPYVNAKKIGIFGGSFSGYETNCIIGQTDIFAAAFSVAGLSNLTSSNGLEDMEAYQRNDMMATINGQNNMGVNLWERPDLYLANSPVMFADRVSCPVLLCHGRQDYRVPFQQGMEFYKALQANGKKVWLVAPNEGHKGATAGVVLGYRYAQQFFGHYLKDEPAPYWMTRPALELLEKGLNPYDYDPENKTPGEGILPMEKTYAPQVFELLKHRTAVDKNGRVVDVKN